MQESRCMDILNFSKWMSFFLNYHERKKSLSPTRRFLLVLDGHKSHVSLEVLLKAKEHGIDMVSLPSHTSHAMQPLDIACFKPFKQSFRAYRDMWAKANIGKRVKMKHLAQWISLGLKKALTSKNIKSGFRGTRIQPYNKEAMAS